MRNPLQGSQALARWNSSAFTRVVSERGRDELCSSRALTVKNGAVRWGVMAGSLLSRCLKPPEVVGASPAPEGKRTDGHACPSLFPAHFIVLFLALCLWAVMGPSNTCSLASLLPLCVCPSLFPPFSSLLCQIYFLFNFIIITPSPY